MTQMEAQTVYRSSQWYRGQRLQGYERELLWVAQKTQYLHDHPRAHVAVALREAQAKLARLKIETWLKTEAEGRTLRVIVQEAALQAAARLDGCYVLQTDLPQTMAAAEVVHDRYKDLALLEQPFRTCKSADSEGRPSDVQTAKT